MPKLVKLPSGTWVDPCAVTLVRVFDGTPEDGLFTGSRKIKPHVQVDYCGCESFYYDTIEEARSAAETIAVEVNKHRE